MNRQNLGDPPGSSYRNRREDGNRPLGEGPRSERGERGYHGGPYRKRGYDEGPGEPNMQVILQGLEPHMNEIDIQRAIEGQGGEIESVILIRNRETRESRCFAFAKFISVEHSRRFIEGNYPYIYIGGHRVRISYSKENKWEEEGWICFSCGINNYPRREVCFKCGVVKQDVTVAGNLTHSAPLVQNDGSQDIATTPSQFLLLRKLDVLTTEELIVKGMAKLQVPIVRVLLIRDRATRQSWGFAFVEYADVNESKKALANAMSLTSNKGFTISSKTIELSFIHGGVFVPVYDQKNEFGFKSSKNGQLLAYWDEKGFTSEYCPESQRPKDESNLPAGEINVSVSQNAASSDNNVSMKEPSILTKDTSTSLKRDANTPCEQKKQKKRYDNSSIKMAPHLQKWAVKQQELRTGLVENEKIDEIFSDLNLMACLLCQRKFKSEKEIRQHEKLSELHKKNLADDDLKEQARQRLKKVSIKKDTDVESLNDSNYRDRAQERRIAFNQPSKPDVPSHNSKKNVINSSPKIPEEPANITKGKGAAILGKMGWTEGMGLGLEGKGISKPLNPEVYQEGVGLGSLGAKLGDNPRPSDYAAYVRSVKDRAKRRYEMEGL
ncbi:hypothetical protein T552_00789 [Pneumocystis carinii B80]|uniref:RNA-binding protein n=1 Tax=Pneumocystis carinii (strain B80) TaxID=1408658 RepID=A0A0W4ZPL2_PNEC8|nr:hypothetical protein T552_00789 [Pneumocystis carinii B80]KTW30316.1 hypothetical protein T552_00789 [Pneumocystis carinii B80]